MKNLVLNLLILHFLSFVLCTHIQVEFNESTIYTLPDLRVNQEEPTCDNAISLKEKAQLDKTRLSSIIDYELPNALKATKESKGFLDNACAAIDNLSTVSLVQKSSSNHDGFVPSSSEMNKLISDKFDNIHSLLQKYSKKGLQNACVTIQDAYADLINYINWLRQQIQLVWLDSYLTNRLIDLDAKISACEDEEDDISSPFQIVPITINDFPSISGYSNPNRINGNLAKVTDGEPIDPRVLYRFVLSQAGSLSNPCANPSYALYENNLLNPSSAVIQNSYFEASALSFGFGVSDGSGTEYQYTIGTVLPVNANNRLKTDGKPVYRISKTLTSFTIYFIDNTSKTATITKPPNDSNGNSYQGYTFDFNITLPVVGIRSCSRVYKNKDSASEIESLQLILIDSYVTLAKVD